MTPEETKEREILSLANEIGKLAVEVDYTDSKDPIGFQDALERLMIRGWIRLIDVGSIRYAPDRMFRIFLASPEAVEWYRKNS